MFADDMIMYYKILRNPLTPITTNNKFISVARYKIYMQKSIVCLYTCNKNTKMKLRK